jgi:glucuronokinase
LVGNPSDGYYGKTISFIVRNFTARVVVYEWPTLEIIPPPSERVRYASLDALAEDVGRNGYYGALRLMKAALKKFHEYCEQEKIELHHKTFSLRYETDVPRGVGMAGSSAIITATFRALMRFHAVEIPQAILPNWILATEKDELRIAAGLQDRVAQVYEGLTYMDFNKEKILSRGYGDYESLTPNNLPPLYLAYRTELAEPSDVVHNNLREKWDAGDPVVHATMQEFRDLTDRARDAIVNRRHAEVGECINANFDLRRKIMAIAPGHLKMVELARSLGASAHFAGSGGTVAGTYKDEAMFDDLQRELGNLGCKVLKPIVAA